MSNIERIIPFLLEANRAGYANDASEIKRFGDGGCEIVFELGEYNFQDYWWGGNPFSGQECVIEDGKTIWAMQYRGWMEPGFEKEATITFRFLRRALKECSADEPMRGPKEFRENEMRYANAWGSDLNNFHGQEKIWHKNRHIYTCNYFGGEVDV